MPRKIKLNKVADKTDREIMNRLQRIRNDTRWILNHYRIENRAPLLNKLPKGRFDPTNPEQKQAFFLRHKKTQRK